MFPAVGTRDGVRKRRSPVLIINRGGLVTRERERERERERAPVSKSIHSSKIDRRR